MILGTGLATFPRVFTLSANGLIATEQGWATIVDGGISTMEPRSVRYLLRQAKLNGPLATPDVPFRLSVEGVRLTPRTSA